MTIKQLSSIAAQERLDAIVEAATEANYQRLNELLDWLALDLDAQNELFTAIVALRDAAAAAAFRAGWQAHAAPDLWILGDVRVDGG